MSITIQKNFPDVISKFDFILKILDKKSAHLALGSFYFDEPEKRIVSTDGHRMHFVDLDEDIKRDFSFDFGRDPKKDFIPFRSWMTYGMSIMEEDVKKIILKHFES